MSLPNILLTVQTKLQDILKDHCDSTESSIRIASAVILLMLADLSHEQYLDLRLELLQLKEE